MDKQVETDLDKRAKNVAGLLDNYAKGIENKVNDVAKEVLIFFLEMMEKGEHVRNLKGLNDDELDTIELCFDKTVTNPFFSIIKNSELLYYDRHDQKHPPRDVVQAVMNHVVNEGQINNGHINAINHVPFEKLSETERQFVMACNDMMQEARNNVADEYRMDFKNPNSYRMSDALTDKIVQLQDLAHQGVEETQQQQQFNQQQQNQQDMQMAQTGAARDEL